MLIGMTGSQCARVIVPGSSAEVISASGDLFWARGMATAEASAMRSDPDYLLWLNDDVRLYPDALRRLLRAAEVFPRHPVLLAGSVCDPLTCSHHAPPGTATVS